jgi:hypothetical protein
MRTIATALVLGLGLLGSPLCWAQSESEPAEPPTEPTESGSDTPLEDFRTPIDVLAERTIGTVAKPVAFNWRRTTAQVAVSGSFLFELNTFNTMRGGLTGRFPAGNNVIVETSVHYARTWDTPSSRLLALTPYRQSGRPNRAELDFTVGYALAEGVVTAFPKWFPPVQIVFNGYAGFRYRLYTAWSNMRPGQVAGAIFNPSLTDIELDNLEDNRLAAMQVDPERYGLFVGFGNDIYFKQGFFLSPRVMIGVPVLAAASGSDMLVFADFTMAVGLAF